MKIEIRNYVKTIRNRTVLDNISYTFESGKIYGLTGRNGCGKTMLLRAISGLIFATSGEVVIDGKILHKDIEFPADMGVIIENTGLLPQYDGYTNLLLLSKIKNTASSDDIRQALHDVGLDDADGRRVKEYSLGMRQKLSIAQAIFEKPKILLLDEPTNALDEASIHNVRTLLKGMADNGTLIIIASHNNEDIELLSDVRIKLENGRLQS